MADNPSENIARLKEEYLNYFGIFNQENPLLGLKLTQAVRTSREDIWKTYPVPVYNYRVTIGEESIPFSQVSGLNIEYDIVTYRHGRSWSEGELHIPGRRKPIHISMKRGIILRDTYMYRWIQTVHLNQVERRDIYIKLCDEVGVPMITWSVLNAFPTKLDAPDFDASTNEVAIQSMDLIATDLLIDYH